MTAGDGFPSGMDPFALDPGTTERLVTGAVDVGDAPPQYRAVAATLSALREPPHPDELLGGPAAAKQIAAVVLRERAVGAARRSRRPTPRARVMVASIAACGLLVTGGLAAAGALPDSAQNVAAAVLRQVGISVPSGDEDPVDHESPPTTSVPISTTAGSVPSGPTGDSPEVAPVVTEGTPPSPRGPRPADVRGKSPVPPPAATDDGAEESAADAPPGNGNAGGNGNGNGNGNAYGHVNGDGNASGHANGVGNGNGNGNAYGHGDVQGAEEAP
jgi:hypothetical protein